MSPPGLPPESVLNAITGRNAAPICYGTRAAPKRRAFTRELATELVALKVNVLVAINRLDALAAQRATSTVPIVFVYVSDPVGSKLVASLAHPGGNITGLSNFAADLTAKAHRRLTILTALAAIAQAHLSLHQLG
jgi:ABC-type uncharacterized transport system substrate-binding protein